MFMNHTKAVKWKQLKSPRPSNFKMTARSKAAALLWFVICIIVCPFELVRDFLFALFYFIVPAEFTFLSRLIPQEDLEIIQFDFNCP